MSREGWVDATYDNRLLTDNNSGCIGESGCEEVHVETGDGDDTMAALQGEVVSREGGFQGSFIDHNVLFNSNAETARGSGATTVQQDSGGTDFSFNHLETGGNGWQLVQCATASGEPDEKQGVQGENIVQQGRHVIQRCAGSGTLQDRADTSEKASAEQGYIQWSETGGVCIPDRPDVAGVRVQQLPRLPHCPGQSVDRVVLSRPRAKSVVSSSYPGLADIYDRVRASARPNYRGCKIPVPSG